MQLSVFDVFLLAVPLGSGVHSVQHTMVLSVNLKCYEYEIINPITCNCPNTDMLSTNMSNLHTMTSTQISTRFSEPLLVLLTSAGLNETLKGSCFTSHYNNSCVANMTSDITFTTKITSREKTITSSLSLS